MGVRQHNVPTATMAALPPKALDGEPLEFTATARVKIRILTRIDIGKRFADCVTHHEPARDFLNGPRRRKAAVGQRAHRATTIPYAYDTPACDRHPSNILCLIGPCQSQS
jgi:hypothetical protein